MCLYVCVKWARSSIQIQCSKIRNGRTNEHAIIQCSCSLTWKNRKTNLKRILIQNFYHKGFFTSYRIRENKCLCFIKCINLGKLINSICLRYETHISSSLLLLASIYVLNSHSVAKSSFFRWLFRRAAQKLMFKSEFKWKEKKIIHKLE